MNIQSRIEDIEQLALRFAQHEQLAKSLHEALASLFDSRLCELASTYQSDAVLKSATHQSLCDDVEASRLKAELTEVETIVAHTRIRLERLRWELLNEIGARFAAAPIETLLANIKNSLTH
jgi:hypothetical protein